MSRRLTRGLITAAAVTTLGLAACSPGGSSSSDPTTSEDGGEQVTVTFRLWDDAAAEAYRTSFDAFEQENPGIRVEIETVPWANYWERLPQDIGAGTMADIFWANTSNFGIYADNGNLLDLGEIIGDDHDEWNDDVADLYTRDGVLYGAPQLSDALALFYNKDIVDAAGIDPTTLRWDPDPADDTLLPALQQVTVDGAGLNPTDDGFNADDTQVYGFNSQVDLQAIYANFLAQAGGQYQDGDQYAFSSPEGVEAFTYLVDLINTYNVAPPAAETNENGDYSRDLFIQGRLAFFQSGQYSLPHLQAIEDFEWGLAPIVEGPEGRIGVAHGIAALGNAATEHPEETAEVLKWISTAEGQLPLGESGATIPAVLGAQSSFFEYWQGQGVDTSVLEEAGEWDSTPAPTGPRANAGAGEITPILREVFAGRIPVAEGLQQAQEAANEAIQE